MAENGPDNFDQLQNIGMRPVFDSSPSPNVNNCESGSRPSSAARGSYRGVESDHNINDGGTMHWFAYLGPVPPISDEEDREARLRSLKERQNEERLKRLEEIKAHALAAQRYKEQKEFERKQRFEELRQRDDARRHQVEERKRAINEAERDRLESILRRNQEREARIEARKRNDRSSMVFAFGSSTPRMLERTETSSSFWGHRRATSTQNITCSAALLSRRQPERELDATGKKRATSAGGLERSAEDALRMSSSMYEIFGHGGISGTRTQNTSLMTRSSSAHFGTPPTTPAGCTSGYVGRRRTDLMPTIPSKETSPGNRKPFAQSPGRAFSMSRLDQLAKPRRRPDLPPVAEAIAPRPLHHSQPSTVSRSMSHLAISKLGPQRPLRKADSRSMHQLTFGAPVPPPRPARATQLRQAKMNGSSSSSSISQIEASSRPSSALSQQSTTSVASSVNIRVRPATTPRRPRPASIAVTGVTSATPDKNDKTTKPPLPKSRKSSLVKSQDKLKRKLIASPSETPKSIPSPTMTDDPIVENNIEEIAITLGEEKVSEPVKELTHNLMDGPVISLKSDSTSETTSIPSHSEHPVPTAPVLSSIEGPEVKSNVVEETARNDAESAKVNNRQVDITTDSMSNEVIDMSASMTKSRITTEEEAKAALAERRRLAREEAERQAEIERLRIEAEYRAEMERQQREEEQQRILIEQMKAAEQERLEEAIRETEKRAEEERSRREEENRQKILKEEADRKAREEVERQKAERQLILQHEEKEREVRRKRVEAIMLRTRGKSNSAPQQNEDSTEKLNGSSNGSTENGHKHGKEINSIDNIIPVETLKNANTVIVDALSTDDALNSNNSNNWQLNNQQTDLLM